MAKAKDKIPAGYATLTPHLIIKDAAKAIEFYKKAFGAEEAGRCNSEDGRIMHADLKIGDSHVFLSDEFPEFECGLSPQTLKNSHAAVHMFVTDVDKAYQKAVDAGAQALMPPNDMFWGDRYGRLVDPFGQPWTIATRVEDLTLAEIEERQKVFMKEMAAAGCAKK